MTAHIAAGNLAPPSNKGNFILSIRQLSQILTELLEVGAITNSLRLIRGLLEKYPTLFVFAKTLVDFNEARLRKATLNLHKHA